MVVKCRRTYSEAFKADGKEAVGDSPVKLPKMIGIRLNTVLHRLLGQVDGTYLIRPDYIEVVPLVYARPESWNATRNLAPLVNAEFTERPLAEALRELRTELELATQELAHLGEAVSDAQTARTDAEAQAEQAQSLIPI